MKINYKNTALGLLDKMDHYQFRISDDGGATTFDEKMALANSIIKIWPNLAERFNKKIQYVTEPFYNAWDKGSHKLASVLDKEPINESGVFVFKPTASETNTIFYSFETWGSGSEWEIDATILFFNNHTKSNKPSLAVVVQRRPGMPIGGSRFYASKRGLDAGITPKSVLVDIYTMVLFLKYCELETKLVKAGKKENQIGVKYVNDTTHNIEILDSTWFTTIVKGDGFNVRGHFRFQPYGPGNTLRKLIWIADFEKEGYTRTAKVLNKNLNNNE